MGPVVYATPVYVYTVSALVLAAPITLSAAAIMRCFFIGKFPCAYGAAT